MKLTRQRKWVRALCIGTAFFVSCTSEVASHTSSSIIHTPNTPQATKAADLVPTQAAQSDPAETSGETTIDCSIDTTAKTATCQVSEYDAETITWSSNASWSTYGGGKWIFQLDEPTTELLVQLKLCSKGKCRTIEDSFVMPPDCNTDRHLTSAAKIFF